MSFGRPGSFSDLVNAPPDRGSFPLDHDGAQRIHGVSFTRFAEADTLRSTGECREQMKAYLECLKKNGATSTPCRVMNKNYLECRMVKYVLFPSILAFVLPQPVFATRGLMERDEWHNLGLDKLGTPIASPGPESAKASPSQPDAKKT